jgi:hypothetical protein
MYGNGIGILRVKIRYSGGEEEKTEKILWEMKGEAGNAWYLGQVPISSPTQSFNVIIFRAFKTTEFFFFLNTESSIKTIFR